jgi:hypothetical protein
MFIFRHYHTFRHYNNHVKNHGAVAGNEYMIFLQYNSIT